MPCFEKSRHPKSALVAAIQQVWVIRLIVKYVAHIFPYSSRHTELPESLIRILTTAIEF